MPGDLLSILHVDMDAFYASVEIRDARRSRPACHVGGVGRRGVVSAASYEARTTASARPCPRTGARLCPALVFLPAGMDRYAAVQPQIRWSLPVLHAAGRAAVLDEAFLDVRAARALHGAPRDGPADQARPARDRPRRPPSASRHKFLAKLASDHGKPDGLRSPAAEASRVPGAAPSAPLGVGAKAERRLAALGLVPWAKLARVPNQVLADHFGEGGRHLCSSPAAATTTPWCRTAKPSPSAPRPRSPTTWRTARAAMWLLDLVDQLAGRLRQQSCLAHTLAIKIRSSAFETWTRAQRLPEASDQTEVLWQSAAALFERADPGDAAGAAPGRGGGPAGPRRGGARSAF